MIDDCNEKLSPKSSGTKIPTPSSHFKPSASVRIGGERANLSSSVPVSSSECGQHVKTYSSGKSSFGSCSLFKSRISFTGRPCFDDDLESVGSVASNFSVATNNSVCEHANFAKNGTTYSGRSHKYIVHCSTGWNGENEYLTPTQRANRSIKKLKSLLQLAKEKLREREEEIFKLNKEVVELRSGKLKNSPDQNTSASINYNCSPLKQKLQVPSNFTPEKFPELPPIRHVVEDSHNLKGSPTPSQDGNADKYSTTPDFFSSMADSGNFDDLTSSTSVYSKESMSLITFPELRNTQDENVEFESEDDKVKAIRILEMKLEDKKLEYKTELKRVMENQEEKNIKMICEFEKKLKEEEVKFESRWNELLKSAEDEKTVIVNRFEKKLEEERQKYKECLNEYKAQNEGMREISFDKNYCKNVEEEKTLYETSLMSMRKRFEAEKSIIERRFDETMTAERHKFEENLNTIKQISESKVADLNKRVSELESEYSELLPKYEKAMTQSDELKKENELLRKKLKEQEENHKKMFLAIYKKGQEAAKLDLEAQEIDDSAGSTSKKISVPELFAQLKITEVELENLKDKEYREAHSDNEGFCLLSSKEAISLWLLAARKAMYKRLEEAQQKPLKKETRRNDPEATLQFLKSAVYYFLTDRENHVGHLKAIESILGFSPLEKTNIENVYLNGY